PGPRPRVAYGDAARGWAGMAASHRRACLAARVADAIEELDAPAVGWEDLGVFQLLAQVPAEELGRSAMDDRIRRLADKPELLHTLAVYLDAAGEAKRAADKLALHRASLYYRLHRIEEIAGIDLHSGADRLAAHLSIGALRLAGRIALPARDG
ncbi:MAG TPA: helix-turn-helix domain-containing protein, partial [Solirubrobacteraceae bacterium]|nr:helix-turn-helix domain-containing protein [Solirubrobacteraceae bacterium]